MLNSHSNGLDACEKRTASIAVSPVQIEKQISAGEPIAIVGIGCRFPGDANDVESFWRLLANGTDAVSQTPEQRWSLLKYFYPDIVKPGKTQSKWGGYVADIDRFDPQLFGISPREAAGMDPQQRMLLEVAWRAIEDGGVPMELIAGQAAAVFVGISSFDYAVSNLSHQDRGVIDAYSNTGGSHSIAANRISYCFDLKGPSVAVDTACSSSLVAVHLACESIWRGDCTLALAGGVNALLMPDFYVAFSQLGVLSPDGRCKTFDSRANGYVRGEGAGMVLLKPLSAAVRDQDRVYAVIRSTATNQDGRTPGLTVPSQVAQEALLRVACQRAGIRPADIQYIEAHGTGTPVGDPIEANALGTVLGEARDPQRPCIIGSVKTNIGHLEAGAGIASLIKVALSLYHQQIPSHLHLQEPNPAIDFDRLKLRVPQALENWQAINGVRLAGINGFGYGGANAHVILQDAPIDAATAVVYSSTSPVRYAVSNSRVEGNIVPCLLPLSARSRQSLNAVQQRMIGWLQSHGAQFSVEELASFAAHRRGHLEYRAAVCGKDVTDLLNGLAGHETDAEKQPSRENTASQLSSGIAFVCSGQGPQWWAMGRQLLQHCPVFRQVIEQCDREFRRYGDWSLVAELNRDQTTSRMQQTSIAQPSIFAIQTALAAVWKSWGIVPTALVGHSVGEIAAAYLSGALAWEEACQVAFFRGHCMDLASSQGRMLAVGLPEREIGKWLDGIDREVSVAAINGPSSLTISGTQNAIDKLAKRLENEDIFCKRLAVEYAFHSPQMEPVCEPLLRLLANLSPRATHTRLFSTVYGREIEGHQLNARYWWDNVRQPVRFAEVIGELANQGFGVLVELGPHPVLTYSITECFQTSRKSVRSFASLHREQDDFTTMLNSLGRLYSLGFDIEWSNLYAKPVRPVPLPTYPFQTLSLWTESRESKLARLETDYHPLLGESEHANTPRWHGRIELRGQDYLEDHRVRGQCVLPAAALIEVGLAAAQRLTPHMPITLNRLQLHNPCILTDNRAQWLETVFRPDRRSLEIASRESDGQMWTSLATVGVSKAGDPPTRTTATLADHLAMCSESVDGNRCYDYCAALGLEYGPRFKNLLAGSRRDGEAIVQVALPPFLADQSRDYCFHPALLDGCFHSMIVADADFDHTLSGLYLPIEIEEIRYLSSPSRRVTVHTKLISKTRRRMVADLDIYDDAGKLCLQVRGFQSQRVTSGKTPETVQDLVFNYEWISSELNPENSASIDQSNLWIVLGDNGNVAKRTISQLGKQSHEFVVARRGNGFRRLTEHEFEIDGQSPEDFDTFLRHCQSQFRGRKIKLLYCWALDVPAPPTISTEALRDSTLLTTLAPLNLVQAWDRNAELGRADMMIITSGGQTDDISCPAMSIAQTPLIGFGRVVVSEFARLRTRLIDLPVVVDDEAIANLVAEVTVSNDEDEIKWRGGKRFAQRFMPQAEQRVTADAAGRLPFQLQMGRTASIEELQFRTKPRLPLKPNEIEIEVICTGLNFSDVMKSLDLYPGLPDGQVLLGAECSGRISRLGSSVEKWRIGDEVIAVAPGAFASHVTVDAALVARKPRALTHAQAAGIPIAFLTAQYALHDCARIRRGESVLVHSASGGVGLAAIQLAQLAGAKILATAGSDEKRSYVEQLGVSKCMDSRSLNFVDEVRSKHRAGVDVVLNSLAGEAIQKGIELLSLGGRFLEIGKRDIYGDAALGLFPFRNNLAFFAIDLDQLFKQQPDRMGHMLRELVNLFDQGTLHPLPITKYSAKDTNAAFRFMQQGKHIGKVVVEFVDRPTDVFPGSYLPIAFNSQATYWIAGGLGGFGMEIARWMVEHGARHLVLSGRSKSIAPSGQTLLDELAKLGARVTAFPADISSAEDVRFVLNWIDANLPPLRGIFHTAMVLEDRLLIDLDRETLDRVLRPKVLGGWNLHRETLGRELDHFVLFSSLSSIFGHAGQANYSAANAMLDGLAHYRRNQALPALVVNWGHLGEVGYLAERQQLGERLQRQGVLSFTVRQATDCLEYAMQTQARQLSVLRMDWSIWRGLGVTDRVSNRFAHLLRNKNPGTIAEDLQHVSVDQLRSTSLSDRSGLVDRLLRGKSSSLLGIPASEIDASVSLLELGLDSLMAVEMRNWIESQFGTNLQISALMRGASLSSLSDTLCGMLDSCAGENSHVDKDEGTSDVPIDSPITGLQAGALLDQLSSLPDQQVSELLAQMMRENVTTGR